MMKFNIVKKEKYFYIQTEKIIGENDFGIDFYFDQMNLYVREDNKYDFLDLIKTIMNEYKGQYLTHNERKNSFGKFNTFDEAQRCYEEYLIPYFMIIKLINSNNGGNS